MKMDVIETQVQRTSPILRVTTDISEFKSLEGKEDIRASETSRSGNSGEPNLRHASNLLQKKKQLRPLFGSPNPYRSSSYYAASAYAISQNAKSNVSPFTQRIMSAKLLRVKQLQNELKDTQIQLHELKNENRLLKTLQKRQDNALKKYEGDQAQLPQLIKSHNEELRVISTQYKQLKASYRELEQKLRQRESELANLTEQHRHLVKLARDKHLGHREKLTKQVEDLKETVKEQSDRIQMLNRRVELESKNYKHQLNLEMARHKDAQIELAMAHETIESLKNLIEAKDKYINNAVPNRFYNKPPGNTGGVQVFSSSNSRFRNIPKTAGPVIVQGKRDSEDTINSANIDHIHQDTDGTSEVSSGNLTQNNNVQNRMKSDSSHFNLRKKISNKKLRIKSNQSRYNLSSNDLRQDNNCDDGTQTPHYSSSLPSVNNSSGNSKYNSSESDTITKMSSIKTKRRVSIGSGHTVISDDTSPYNDCDDFDDDYKDENYNTETLPHHDDGDSIEGNNNNSSFKDNKSNKKIVCNKQDFKKEKLKSSSLSITESDGPLESINDSLMKAQAKDRLIRQKSIKDELKELEERLKLNNRKFALEKNSSFDSLFDQKAQSVKDELKEFEERLLNSTDLTSYNSSISKTFEEEADKVVKKCTTGLDIDDDDKESISYDKSDEILNSIQKFDFKGVSLSWNNMREEFQRERERTETLLDEYYEKMTLKNEEEDCKYNNDDNYDDKRDDDGNEEIEEQETDVKLAEGEKVKLLRRLKEIDHEDGGRKDSVFSSDSEPKDLRNSLNCSKYHLNSTENLNNIKASYSYDFPKLNNIDNLENDFTQDFDKIKSKTDLMEELFGTLNPFKSNTEGEKNLGNT